MLTYTLYPKLSDQGILCIGRGRIHLLMLGQKGDKFNSLSIKEIVNLNPNSGTTSASITNNGQSIVFNTAKYENVKFIGSFIK